MQGWMYGETRDDVGLLHPQLVPWSHLTRNERLLDRTSAAETIKVILVLGYTMQRNAAKRSPRIVGTSSLSMSGAVEVEEENEDGEDDDDAGNAGTAQAADGIVAQVVAVGDSDSDNSQSSEQRRQEILHYTPQPIDTSDIKLPSALQPLVELLAHNIHEARKGCMTARLPVWGHD